MIPIAQRETRTRPIRDGLSYSTNGYHDAGISDREMKLATRGERGDVDHVVLEPFLGS